MKKKDEEEKYVIRFGDQAIGYINRDLAAVRNITPSNIKRIKELHVTRHLLFELAKVKLDNRETLKNMVTVLENLEFELQKAWKFEQDNWKHTWWNKIPGCTCPKVDNQDTYGTPFRYYSGDCPFHGK